MINCDGDIDKVDQYLQNSEIYIDNARKNIKSYKELIPYFPRLIVIGGFGKSGCTIRITNRSYVDEQEEKIYGEYHSVYDKLYREPLAEELSKYGYSDEFISSLVYQGRKYIWRKKQ